LEKLGRWDGMIGNMPDNQKSILADIQVKETGFPLGGRSEERLKSMPAKLEIVGHCPKCGAPVYGPKTVGTSETMEPIEIRYGCPCLRFGKDLGMQTK
jgi:hypothetical protein